MMTAPRLAVQSAGEKKISCSLLITTTSSSSSSSSQPTAQLGYNTFFSFGTYYTHTHIHVYSIVISFYL
jgi:hypothetical protein